MMNHPLIQCLFMVLVLMLPVRACNETRGETPDAATMASRTNDSTAFPEADKALLEARVNLGDADDASIRIARLERMIDKYPDYPYRADLYYFIGLNAQLLGNDRKVVRALEAAAKADPAIADGTPLRGYLRTAKARTLRATMTTLLAAVLILCIVFALSQLGRPGTAALPWQRIIAVYAVTIGIWTLIAFFAPLVYGPLKAGLEKYPKPILSNYLFWETGTGALRALYAYGAAAVLATLPVIAAAAHLRKKAVRSIATVIGVIAVIGSVMGLYGMRNLFAKATFDGPTHRLVVFIKSIDSVDDVPDAMFKLYDKNFAKRVMEKRAAKGEHHDHRD